MVRTISKRYLEKFVVRKTFVGTMSWDDEYKRMVMDSIRLEGTQHQPMLFKVKLTKRQLDQLNKFLDVGDWLCATKFLNESCEVEILKGDKK